MTSSTGGIEAVALRRFIYDELVERGLPPTSDAIGRHFGTSAGAARDAMANLKIGKAVLLHPKTGEIWMAGPFAAVPTTYVVSTTRQRWFANCAWDMLGVAAIINEQVTIEAECADCGEQFRTELAPGGHIDSDWIVHFLCPARRWYDDIGFT